ncbi:hypothetical protein [Candidatus Amarolinea aalborgensis]|jgi:hypothetical protein|uniref:hypothetical protein n=1 Tax=Candidatus Amarolinea aalborgensis TaxID=2249329 RepID=UPI003BFA339F
MFELTYRPTTVRAIVIGVAVLGLLCLVAWSLGSAVKVIGATFLFLPDQLGIIRQVHRAEVISFHLNQSPTTVTLAAGRYAVYVADIDLLTATDLIIEAGGPPWLAVKSQDTGQSQPVSFISRGMAFYDTPLAPGRPIMSFAAPAAGRYELTQAPRPVEAALVRDYTSGHETLLLLIYVVQLAVILGVPALLYVRRHREEWEMIAALRAQRRVEADAFWGSEQGRKPKG